MKDRDLRSEGVFIAEGRFLVERAVLSGLNLHSILCLPSLRDEFQELVSRNDINPPVMTASKSEMEELCGYSFHRGVLAAGYRPSSESREIANKNLLNDSSRLIIASDVRDPFNLGGLFRSASALGWAGMVLIDGCADPFSRAALRASMGAVFTMPFFSGENDNGGFPELLKEEGFTLTGAVLPRAGSISVDELRAAESLPMIRDDGEDKGEAGVGGKKIALMIGNEGEGLSEERIVSCDQLVSIPMTDRVDSLNVGVAAGILMYLI